MFERPSSLLVVLSLVASALAPRATGEQWVSLGPAPTQGGSAGRVACVAVHPTNPGHWLVGAAEGGVWRTTDAGATWTPLTDAQPSLAMGALAFAPGDPNVVYAGTGDRTLTVGSYAGRGLLKSTDGGTTWRLLAASTFTGSAFTALAVDPSNANVLVATTAQGGTGLDPWAEPPARLPRGIFKSTDGGVSWTQKGPAVESNNGWPIGDGTALQADPGSFNRMYAAIGSAAFGTTNGVYRSTDAGETWTLVAGPWSSAPGGTARVALALAPSDPDVLYVAVAKAATQGLLGLWRTDEAWAPAPRFTQVPTAATDGALPGYGYCGSLCWFTLEIGVDPGSADTLYAAGAQLWKCTHCGPRPAWSDVTNGLHVDQHALAWAGGRLIVGNDGGVWTSGDGGASWSAHNRGLAITQFWGGCLHPTRPDVALGGSQDQGGLRWTGRSWTEVGPPGDAGRCAISAAQPDTHWASGATRTLDGAATPFREAWSGIDWSQPRVFAPPLAKCPASDEVFLTATSTLYRSDNFFRGAPALWSPNSPFQFDGAISAVAFQPSDPGCSTYAFGTQRGRLFVTTDAGASWSDLDPGGQVPDRYVSGLAFHPGDANVLYVTLAGFDGPGRGQAGHVFRTATALSSAPSWTDVSPPADVPHDAIAIDPVDPRVVFVGTDDGLWRSADGGASWSHASPRSGLPRVPVYDVQIGAKTGRVLAFTHGRGAFKLAAAELELRADAPAEARAGARWAYTLIVANHGPDEADDVTLLDRLPRATLLSAAPSQGSCVRQPDRLTCRLGRLGVEGRASVRIEAVPAEPGALLGRAQVSSATGGRRAHEGTVEHGVQVSSGP